MGLSGFSNILRGLRLKQLIIKAMKDKALDPTFR